MIPAGYLLKRTVAPPGWLQPNTAHITEIYSVSNCVNEDVVDPQNSWKHNGFGVANDPEVLWDLAREFAVDMSGSSLCFYSVYEYELISDGWIFDLGQWRPISRVALSSILDDVVVPGEGSTPVLLGFDIVVFGHYLEHSPLSCNSVATDVRVNRFCLFDDFADAKSAIDSGKFGGGCEEGIYKIFSVSVLSNPNLQGPLPTWRKPVKQC